MKSQAEVSCGKSESLALIFIRACEHAFITLMMMSCD